MTITIRIPGAPPLPNKSSKAGSWHARATARRKWREVAQFHALNACGEQGMWDIITACTIHVEHVLPDRRKRDLDNLAAACKALLDGIVDARVIAGDDTTVIRSITHTASVVKGVRETVITIVPLED